MDGFVNRVVELERLTDLYDSNSAELAIVYGRRRLGKTELVKQSLSNRENEVIYNEPRASASGSRNSKSYWIREIKDFS